MFAWRKRNDGFEWRKYVRTTILVRRQERRRRIENAKEAAVFGVKQAGRRGAGAAATGLSSAGRGLAALGLWLVAFMHRFLQSSGAALSALGATLLAAASLAAARLRAALAPALSRAASRAAIRLEPVLDALRRPGLRLPLALIAGIAGLAAVARIFSHGPDAQVLFAGAISLAGWALMLAPRLTSGNRPRPVAVLSRFFARAGESLVLLPGFEYLRPVQASTLTLLLLVGAAGAGLWLAVGPAPSAPRLAAIAFSSGPKLEGRAEAVTGDSLRVSGTFVTLAGIEAPERDQPCSKPGVPRWRCGAAARQELARMVRGERVTCELSRSEEQGRRIGRCTARGADIAAELVRGGHVFAAPGLFARYASLERAAKNAKSGLWAGQAERPSDYRAKLWEEAKRGAPEGCPIKGRVSSGVRVYLLPWSPSYANVKVRAGRGERWFCSEAEALAAGWRPVARL